MKVSYIWYLELNLTVLVYLWNDISLKLIPRSPIFLQYNLDSFKSRNLHNCNTPCLYDEGSRRIGAKWIWRLSFVSLVPGRFWWNFRPSIFKVIIVLAGVSLKELPSLKCHWILLVISQHWIKWGIGTVRQLTITWANVNPDLCRNVASPGQNELFC